MPQHKSAKKRVKGDLKKRRINQRSINKFRSAVKDFYKQLDANKSTEIEKSLNRASSMMSRAVNRGILKKKTASRKISKLSKLIKKSN
mgnify:CR=1 FL=1|tara:strand:- start:349 stop:612 length:264 start_codon:yes stop_codon:yes gene_type:complete